MQASSGTGHSSVSASTPAAAPALRDGGLWDHSWDVSPAAAAANRHGSFTLLPLSLAPDLLARELTFPFLPSSLLSVLPSHQPPKIKKPPPNSTPSLAKLLKPPLRRRRTGRIVSEGRSRGGNEILLRGSRSSRRRRLGRLRCRPQLLLGPRLVRSLRVPRGRRSTSRR